MRCVVRGTRSTGVERRRVEAAARRGERQLRMGRTEATRRLQAFHAAAKKVLLAARAAAPPGSAHTPALHILSHRSSTQAALRDSSLHCKQHILHMQNCGTARVPAHPASPAPDPASAPPNPASSDPHRLTACCGSAGWRGSPAQATRQKHVSQLRTCTAGRPRHGAIPPEDSHAAPRPADQLPSPPASPSSPARCPPGWGPTTRTWLRR